jgi:hypothetical protein
MSVLVTNSSPNDFGKVINEVFEYPNKWSNFIANKDSERRSL